MRRMALLIAAVVPMLAGGLAVVRGAFPEARGEMAAGSPAPAAADIKARARVFAPWDPARLPALRKHFGLLGPGPQGKPPKPRFPADLRKVSRVEDLLPAARAAVTQTGGRSPLGLARAGELVLIPVGWDADSMVQEAIKRAYAERKIEARILFEHELAGIAEADLEAIRKAESVFSAGDGQQEPRNWFFMTIPDGDKARGWVRARDPELYAAVWPEIRYPEPRLAKLAKTYGDRTSAAVVKYLDAHREVTRIFWRSGGRPWARRALGRHADKFAGNYTYLDQYDILSKVPQFPPDVWRLMETKTIEPLLYVDRLEVSDPEGTVLVYDLTPEDARVWSKGVYLQGHLYMFPAQASGQYPSSRINYPALEPEYLPPIQNEVNGVIASTNNHMATHNRMEVYVRNGKIAEIKGGGLYGELWRLLLNYPGTQTLTWPLYQKPGYWWLWEAGTGTNPKYFKHPAEILKGRNSSERNVGGVIHWSFGTEAVHGPEKFGDVSPKTLAFAKQHNVPSGHSMHNHTLLPTYQVRIRSTGRWETLINYGRVTALDDPEVRALAARYGKPEDVLRQEYVPPIPGITIQGTYDDYGRDPGAYWTRWAKSIMDGSYPYFSTR